MGELFAGAGGMALGAASCAYNGYKFSHVWANDIDADACKTFEHNVSKSATKILNCDAAAIDYSRLPPIDGLAFGFPCNDFSVLGKKHGLQGRFGGLYQQGVRALQAQRPLFFIAENVGGLASSGGALEIITKALRQCGYRVNRHVYKFEEYGVPQARHRIIFVGFRNDIDVCFNHPQGTTINKPVTCKEALTGIDPTTTNNELPKQSKIVTERLKHIRPGQNVFTATMPEHLQLKMRSNAKFSQTYKRLDPTKPAYTVTASGGGGTHVYHYSEPRALTNRERARLQSFPDTFEFLGAKESVRKQIGMAVPPKGAASIFQAVLECLVNNKVKSQSC